MNYRSQTVDFIQFSTDLEAAQTHLNIARTAFQEEELVSRLSVLCAQAGRVAYRTHPVTWQSIQRWFLETFPAAFWSLRYWILLSSAIFIVTAALFGLWAIQDHNVLDAFMSPNFREDYVDHEFIDYYSNQPSAVFFSLVTTNNIGIAITAFGSGILFAVPTLFVLVINAIQLGGAWAVFVDAGQQSTFWLYIAPHGCMELFAIFVSGAMGMAMGWTWIDPGPRSRGEAFADVGSRAVTVAIGGAFMLVIAGLIEGFVTGSPLPLWFKAAFGFAVWLSFTATVSYLGWQASKRGLSGTLKQAERIEFSLPATTVYKRYT